MTHDEQHQDPEKLLPSASPPDRAAAGDVSTTGHSAYDVHEAVGQPEVESDHDGHAGHGPDVAGAAEVSTLVPVGWKQLILPALILLLAAILVAGPIFGAFASRPAPPPTPQPHTGMNSNIEQAARPTSIPQTQSAKLNIQPSATLAAIAAVPASPTEEPPTATQALPTVAGPTIVPPTAAPVVAQGATLLVTQTAVAAAGENGVVARVPVELSFEGATFVIKTGSNLLPDWKPSPDVGIATWIEGTVANHILYVPYSPQTEALFKAAKAGDMVKLVMNTGQVFEFQVNSSRRAINGPPTEPGQFTVSTAMSQDHAGVTLFLIGDPAADRAVVQADFTGNIQ